MDERSAFGKPEQPNDPLAGLEGRFAKLSQAKHEQETKTAERLEQEIIARLEGIEYPELNELYHQACIAYWVNINPKFGQKLDPNISITYAYLRDYLLESRFPLGTEHNELTSINTQIEEAITALASELRQD